MNTIQAPSISPCILPFQPNVVQDFSSGDARHIAKQTFQELNSSFEKERFKVAFRNALNLIGVMRKDLQMTNALFLEKVIKTEKAYLAEKLPSNGDAEIEEIVIKSSDKEIKNSKEHIEDAMDSLKEVPLLDQLAYLKEYPLETEVIKKTLIDQLHQEINVTIHNLERLQEEFCHMTKQTVSSNYQLQILELIGQKKEELLIAKQLYRSRNFIRGKDQAIPIKQLNSIEVRSYVLSVSNAICEMEKDLELRTCARRIGPVLKKYTSLNEELLNALPLLVQNGNYLGAHYLAEVQKKNKEIIANFESTLNSSLQLKLYADALENGVQDIEKTVLKIHEMSKNSLPIDELKSLEQLKSPYVKDLQELILIQAEGKIDSYMLKLSQYVDLLSLVIDGAENSVNKEALLAINEKLLLKKSQAEELKNTFAIKKGFFWQHERENIKIEDLNVKQLEVYLKTVDEMIEQSEEELNEEALKAGFTWD